VGLSFEELVDEWASSTLHIPASAIAKRRSAQSMLSILLRYGAELGLPGCLDLAQVLDHMILRVPQETRRAWKEARPKKAGMSYEHAAAIVAEGLRRGTRRARSVALGGAAQFELTLRQGRCHRLLGKT
jgi:hypothetical protein